MSTPYIHVILNSEQIPNGLTSALRRMNASASFESLAQTLEGGRAARADAVVLVDDGSARPDRVRALLHRCAGRGEAMLVLRDAPGWTADAANAADFADEHALTEQLTRLVARGAAIPVDAPRERPGDAAQRLVRRYREQMEQAARLQREMLPAVLPRFGACSFSAVFRPMELVSGDLYDVRVLDGEHVGITLADAEGHGVAAAMLGAFVRQTLGSVEAVGRRAAFAPDEVLQRLNQNLLDAALPDCHFIAVIYAVLNTRSGQLRLSRAGAPYPIVRRANGQIEELRGGGCLAGVVREAEFHVTDVTLRPGDALLLHSDGVSAVFPAGGEHSHLSESAPRPWLQTIANAGAPAALEMLSDRHDMLRRMERDLDDVTALSVEFKP